LKGVAFQGIRRAEEESEMDTRGNVTRGTASERHAFESDDPAPAGLDDPWFDWPKTPLRSSPPLRSAPPQLGDGLADGWFV
jgi:hypothetical protein